LKPAAIRAVFSISGLIALLIAANSSGRSSIDPISARDRRNREMFALCANWIWLRPAALRIAFRLLMSTSSSRNVAACRLHPRGRFRESGRWNKLRCVYSMAETSFVLGFCTRRETEESILFWRADRGGDRRPCSCSARFPCSSAAQFEPTIFPCSSVRVFSRARRPSVVCLWWRVRLSAVA
jgi:hypothetical protein